MSLYIFSAGRTKVARPLWIALAGMPSYFAVAGSCTKETPPAPSTARRPSVPSVPLPERMTAIAFSPVSSARDRRNVSIGILCPRRLARTAELERTVEDGHFPVRRDDIDMIGLNCHLVVGLDDRDVCDPLEDLRKHARMARVEVGHQDKRHAAIGRNFLKEEFESFESTGRCTDTNDRKTGFHIGFLYGLRAFSRSSGFFWFGGLLHSHLLIFASLPLQGFSIIIWFGHPGIVGSPLWHCIHRELRCRGHGRFYNGQYCFLG